VPAATGGCPGMEGIPWEKECGPLFVRSPSSEVSLIKGPSTHIKYVQEEEDLLVTPNSVETNQFIIVESMIF
jgi:hypothetical protein